MVKDIENTSSDIVEALKHGVEKLDLNSILPHLNDEVLSANPESRIKILESVNQKLEDRGLLPKVIAEYGVENMEALKTPVFFGLTRDRAIKKSDLDDRLASPTLQDGPLSAAPIDRLILHQMRSRFDEIRSSLDPHCRRDFFDGGQICEKQPWGLDREVLQAYRNKTR